jgi:hypothetical protein
MVFNVVDDIMGKKMLITELQKKIEVLEAKVGIGKYLVARDLLVACLEYSSL